MKLWWNFFSTGKRDKVFVFTWFYVIGKAGNRALKDSKTKRGNCAKKKEEEGDKKKRSDIKGLVGSPLLKKKKRLDEQ